jgi:Zn-finger nucleic acid-binding protein
MFSAEQYGTTLDACGACGGVWVDNKLGAQIARIGNGVAKTVATMADAAAQRAVDLEAAINCPDCATPLTRVAMPDYLNRPVDIDCCGQHGTWFDRGELATLLAVVAGRKEARDQLDIDLARSPGIGRSLGDDDKMILRAAVSGAIMLAKIARFG